MQFTPSWMRKRKPSPVQLTGVGQLFEYKGHEMVLMSIHHDRDRGIEITVVSTERYRSVR